MNEAETLQPLMLDLHLQALDLRCGLPQLFLRLFHHLPLAGSQLVKQRRQLIHAMPDL